MQGSTKMPLDEWASAVQNVSEGTRQALQGLERLCELCAAAGPSQATDTFRRKAISAGNAFLQALDGTGAMVEGLQSVPEELRDGMQMSRSLMGLLYGQMVSYYAEMNDASSSASKGFAYEKSVTFGSTTPRRQSQVDSADVADAGEKKEKKEKKDKKDKKDKQNKKGSPKEEIEGDKQRVEATESDAAELSVPVSPTREGSSIATSPMAPGRLPFIKVRDTLNDSLGVAVITTRPDVFLPFERIVTEADVKTNRCDLRYYLVCGSLQEFLTTVLNSSNTDEAFAEKQQEATLDLLCDALVSEDINVLPFCTASGEVVLDGSHPLPSCMWRTADGAPQGSEAMMTTFVAFVDHISSGLGQCLVFHDVLDRSEDEKEQIVHVIKTVASGKENTALLEVTVYHPPSSLLGGAANAAALGGLYRRFFTSFFQEASYSPALSPENVSLTSDTQQMRKANADASALKAKKEADAQAAAVAAERKHAKKGKGGIIGLTKAIATAPLTAVSALNDVSQSAVFKNNFPDLQDEEVITSYNCAWLDGSKVLKQGYLFATTGHLCFQSTVLSAQFILAYDDIEGMRKAKNAMFDNSIEVEDYEGSKYFLTSFMSRDEAYKALFKAWTTSR